MKQQTKKYKQFTPLDKQKLMEEYLISSLSMKEYTNLKGIGLSTFTRWGRQSSFSLSKKNKRQLMTKSEAHPIKKDMPFINLTPYFQSETTIPKDPNLDKLESPLSLSVLMPNGLMVKVDKILEDQAVRLIKGLI